MITVFILGISLMVMAPLLRRYRVAALAVGASAVLVLAIIGLVHQDPRIGQAAIEANRRYDLITLVCELVVLVLALISWRHFKWTFWVGWAINLVFALLLAALVIWLEFFWHW